MKIFSPENALAYSAQLEDEEKKLYNIGLRLA
jgi:hypothetical protein